MAVVRPDLPRRATLPGDVRLPRLDALLFARPDLLRPAILLEERPVRRVPDRDVENLDPLRLVPLTPERDDGREEPVRDREGRDEGRAEPLLGPE